MNKYPLWRYMLLGFLIVLGLLYALPNFYSTYPSLQIAARDSSQELPNNIVATIKNSLQTAKIPYLKISNNQASKKVIINFKSANDQLQAKTQLIPSLGQNVIISVNLLTNYPNWLKAIGAKPMKLGLDLQGGIHFLLQVKTSALLKSRLNSDMRSIGMALRHNRITYNSMRINLASEQILIQFSNPTQAQLASTNIKKQYPAYQIDSNGQQNLLSITLPTKMVNEIEANAISQNIMTLNKRINELGVGESSVVQQGKDQISVDLPGVQDATRARSILGKMASLSFQLVDDQHSMQQAEQGDVPFGSSLYHFKTGEPILLKDQVILHGESIINANATTDSQNGTPAVAITLGNEEVPFHRITSANVGKRLAVVYEEIQNITKIVNGKPQITQNKVQYVISAPVINSALGAAFNINGLSSMNEANDLSLILRSGSLSAPMTIVQNQIVGPSLGKENIEKGVRSVLVGSLLVILFMALYYRLFGIVADLALILNIVFIVAFLSVLGATLTLPGIAAIVLTVGMAVDANVLINERIREELRLGCHPQAAIHAGYGRAFSTIVDANITTLIVAVILFALGTSTVKSFAVSLIIGLLTSMITAIFFTRAIINLAYGSKRKLERLAIGIHVVDNKKKASKRK